MSNTFGKIFRITTWGESHGPAVGVVVDGCPAGLALSASDIQADLDRRRPGQSKVTSSRQEPDQAEILSGVFEGQTLGTPISIMVHNQDVRLPDYDALKDVFRPGHADYAWQAKYGIRDFRGGGRASGRETVGRVAGGAIARVLLRHIGIDVLGFVSQVEDIKLKIKNEKLKLLRQEIENSIVRCPDEKVSAEMVKLIEDVRATGDSVGGIVAIIAYGVPVGLGEPVFVKLSADLAGALMSIPAVKAVEIGSGFDSARMRGSEHNDKLIIKNEKIKMENLGVPSGQTITNNAGGISGGISNGMPIVVRIAVKPTSSISQEQETIDARGHNQKIKITGRHDPCLCPRVVPVAEAMMALVLADHYLISRTSRM